MALVHKYTLNIDHQFGGSSRYAKIYSEGYSGSVTELTGTGIPAILDYPGADNEIFDSIFGSELVLRMWNLSADQYIEFASAKNRDYLVELVNDSDSVVEWQGFLLPSELEESWNQAPYETELVFNCGAGLLDGYDFLDTDGSFYIGRATLITIISDVLSKIYPSTIASGLRPDIVNSNSLLESTISLTTSNSCLATTYLNRNKYVNEDGTVWNCLDVLRDIMDILQSRIQMAQNGWNIVRLRDYAKFYDSYDIPTQTFDADGSYQGNGGYAVADYGKTLTGPQARASMIGWIDGSQRVRYERAYQKIKLKQLYHYINVILDGSFKLSNWDDFWTTSGTVTRVQSGEDLDSYAIKLNPAAYIQQSIDLEGTTTSPSQILILSFEGMVEHDNSYTNISFTVYMTRDAPVSQYLVGQIGGASPSNPAWQAGSGYTYFTDEDGLPESGVWQKYEMIIPYFPSDAAIVFRLAYPATAGSGSITGAYYRNVSILGTYDGEPPTKQRLMELMISNSNIEIMPEKEFNLGDIDESGNEGIYFDGALSLDADGASPTELWQSTRRSGFSRLEDGPVQPIMDYVQGGYAVQYGAIRKRLSGRLVLDNHRWIMLSMIEDSIHYAFTKLTIDLKRGECDVSMIEIPEASDLGENLILGWTNNDFDSFAATDDLITALTSTGSGKYADADDAISYNQYDRFRVTVEGTMTASGFRLAFGGYNLSISDGFNYDIIPSAAGSSTPRLSATVGTALSMTNVTITIKKIYGY